MVARTWCGRTPAPHHPSGARPRSTRRRGAHTDDVLVEPPSGLLIGGDEGVVVQSRGGVSWVPGAEGLSIGISSLFQSAPSCHWDMPTTRLANRGTVGFSQMFLGKRVEQRHHVVAPEPCQRAKSRNSFSRVTTAPRSGVPATTMARPRPSSTSPSSRSTRSARRTVLVFTPSTAARSFACGIRSPWTCFAFGDGSPDLGGDLIVERQRV